MLKQLIDMLLLQYRLAKTLRLRRKLGALNDALALKERFPAHGRYAVGDLEVHRWDASGGYNVAAFLKDNPAVEKRLHVAKYQKPRVEKVEVKERRLARV